MATASHLLHCFDGYSCLGYWNEFFFIYVSGFRWKFCRIAVSRKRWQLESKTDLTTTALLLYFFVGICLVSSTSYLNGLKFACLAQLLFSFDEINISRKLFQGYSGLFFKNACTL